MKSTRQYKVLKNRINLIVPEEDDVGNEPEYRKDLKKVP